jgi:membrane glycosyltransferase
VRLGDAARRIGLLRIPEETDPPVELQEISRELRRTRARLAPAAARGGFARAIADPVANALQRAVARGARRLRPEILAARQALAQRALAEGPASLSLRERRTLLGDARILDELHRAVWALPEAGARAWGTSGAGPLANP